MRNKNHNKRINHNNGLKIAIMLLGVMVGQGRVMCVTEGLGEGTATGSQGGAAIPALPFLRTFPADSMRNTGRGRGLRQELNTSRPQRASSLGVTPSSSSNELYPSVAPGSQVKPGQRWNRNAPLPRLQWGQPGGPAAADAPASPTPRSRSPERSGSGVGSHGPTPRSPRPEECTHINMAGDSDQEDEEFEMFEGYEALSPRRQKAKLELEEKLTKTELDASGSNDGEVKTDEEGIDKILKRDNMPFLLEKRMILDKS